MIGLLKKDLLVTYKSFGVAFIILFLAPLSGNDVITGLAFLIVALTPMILMELDSTSGWDKMLATLPMQKNIIVASKYIICYILLFPMALLSLLAINIFPLLDIATSVDNTFLILSICATLSFMSINNLILFIFGVAKGKIAYFGFIALFYLIGNFVLDPNVIFDALMKMVSQIDDNLIYVVLGTIAINLASMFISMLKAKFSR